MSDDLNNAVSLIIEDWKENGNHSEFYPKAIQKKLDNLIIIGCGGIEYKEKTDDTKYSIHIENTENYTDYNVMRSNTKVNYMMIYDSNNSKYYNVEISCKTVKFKDSEYDYPVFSNATLLK